MNEVEAAGEFWFPRPGRGGTSAEARLNEWRVNVTQLKNRNGSPVDGTDARSFSEGEIEGRRQILDYLRFLRTKVPGFENAYVLDIAPQIGIRETRRLVGEATAPTAEDVLTCADFEDCIGVNGWPLEKHIAGDVQWLWPPIPQFVRDNHLPYRMLLPRRATCGGVVICSSRPVQLHDA